MYTVIYANKICLHVLRMGETKSEHRIFGEKSSATNSEERMYSMELATLKKWVTNMQIG
jgi:protease II